MPSVAVVMFLLLLLLKGGTKTLCMDITSNSDISVAYMQWVHTCFLAWHWFGANPLCMGHNDQLAHN